MRFVRVLLVIIMILAVAWAALALTAKPREASAFMRQLPAGGTVLAHAGGNLLWPDNTMTAFEGATTLGVDVLELDVQQNVDGVFMVIHDDTVDRTTDGSGKVLSLPGSELALLDAAHNWTVSGTRVGPPPDALFHYRGQGIRVPTLTEVLAAFPDALVNVELKQDDAEAGLALCRQLQQEGAAGRVMVASFHSAPMRAFRTGCPEVATSATRSEVTLFYLLARARLSSVHTPAFDALQVPVRQGSLTIVTPAVVAAAQARGVAVQVWTVNERAEMDRLFAMGVDGLITDRPDRALTALGRSYPAAVVPEFVQP
jgi:glycerophosphoryl diester phosphodiesterase